jgi:PAS domain-containing protein
MMHYFARNSDNISRLPYLEYYPHRGAIYISSQASKIAEGKSILDEEVLFEDYRYPLKDLLEDLDKNYYKNNGLITLNAKSYRIDLKKSDASILVLFVDVSDEAKKQLDLEKSYNNVLQSKEFLNQIFDNIPIPVWVRNKKLAITYFNKAYSDIAYGNDQAFDPDALEIDVNLIQSAKNALDQNTMQIEERLIAIDGSLRLYNVINTPINSAQEVVTVALDITSTGVIKQELMDIKSSHQNLLDSMSYGCMIIGSEKKVEYYNDALCKMWGLDKSFFKEDTTHSDILDFLYSSQKLPEQYNYKQFKDDRLAIIADMREPREDLFYMVDGRCIKCVVIPHINNSLLFTYEDMTKTFSLERLNNILNAVQECTIKNLQEGVIVFDAQGEVELVNDVMINIWDLEDEEEVYKLTLPETIDKLLASCSTKDDREKLHQAFTTALVSRLPTTQVVKNFDNKTLHRAIIPLPNRGLLISDIDISDSYNIRTALVGQNSALIYNDRLRSEFLYQMSQKLRAILTSIKGIQQMFLAKLTPKAKQSNLDNLIQTSDYLSRLVEEVGNITTLEEGYDEFTNEVFNLENVINKVMEDFADKFMVKGLSCVFNNTLSSSSYFGDKAKIERIFRKNY